MTISVSNEQIQRHANQFARFLDDIDTPVRGVVAALLPNAAEFLYVFRGSTWSGRTFTPINWHLSSADIEYILQNSEACAIVLHAQFIEHLAMIHKYISPKACVVVGAVEQDTLRYIDFKHIESFDDLPLAQPLAGAVMMYTSGTTGRPKGVKASEPSIGPPPCFSSKMGSMMLEASLPGNAHGKHLVAAPLYHAAPSTYAEGAALLGADLVIMEKWDAETFLRLVESEKIVSTFLVPTHIVRLVQLPDEIKKLYDTRSLKLICHGAAPISQAIKQQALEWLGPILFEFYGGTEGGGTSISADEWLTHPGSVGKPRPGLLVHVLDQEGKPCAVGVAGDVYFSSSEASFEYKDDPDKTASNYRGNKYTLGDIGYVDEEGYLYLCDRKADTIISGGVNIYPAQIEAVLLAHPSVLDCCVVGIPNEEWGESVLAVVQLSSDIAGSELLKKEILKICDNDLARFQMPRKIIFSESLPRTETGKLQRRKIRDHYRKNPIT